MDKVVGTFDPVKGEVKNVDGKIIIGSIMVNGVELNTAVLADAVWQGCKHMEQETTNKDTAQERRNYLLDRMKTALKYHYIILGCSEHDAETQADDYVQRVIKG